MPPDMPEVMAEVARGTSIPIATGERLTTKFEFARVIETRAATILQPDLGRSGGILETKKIAAMAEAYHIQIAPHCYCGPIVGARQHPACGDAAELPDPRIPQAVGRLPREAAEEEDRMAGRQRHPVEGARPRRRTERSRLRGASLRRQGAASCK